MKRLGRMLVMVFGLILLGKALERRGLPAQGRLLGVVPYDFRTPTLARLRSAYWDPDNPQLMTAKGFGVGWGLNVAAVLRKAGLL
jgi:hypothetical protein